MTVIKEKDKEKEPGGREEKTLQHVLKKHFKFVLFRSFSSNSIENSHVLGKV